MSFDRFNENVSPQGKNSSSLFLETISVHKWTLPAVLIMFYFVVRVSIENFIIRSIVNHVNQIHHWKKWSSPFKVMFISRLVCVQMWCLFPDLSVFRCDLYSQNDLCSEAIFNTGLTLHHYNMNISDICTR